jgi:hypothetical protein
MKITLHKNRRGERGVGMVGGVHGGGGGGGKKKDAVATQMGKKGQKNPPRLT